MDRAFTSIPNLTVAAGIGKSGRAPKRGYVPGYGGTSDMRCSGRKSIRSGWPIVPGPAIAVDGTQTAAMGRKGSLRIHDPNLQDITAPLESVKDSVQGPEA